MSHPKAVLKQFWREAAKADSPTPISDAAMKKIRVPFGPTSSQTLKVVDVEVARGLERQLTEARGG